MAGYGLATASWQLMVACLCFNALETAGTIVWATIKQRHVPASMLGRVSSLDWMISIGLLPLSFALTGPVSELVGAQTTLVLAGVAGAAQEHTLHAPVNATWEPANDITIQTGDSVRWTFATGSFHRA